MNGKENNNNFIKETQTLQRYGLRMQEHLCQIALDDRSFCDQLSEVLDVSFLELKYLRVFIQKIFEYRKKYNTHPSREIMAMILRAEIEKEEELVQKQVRDYFARIESNSFQAEGEQHIKDIALDFCKKQKLKEALIKSVDLIQNSSFEDVSKVMNDALKLGTDNNYGYDYILDFEKRFQLIVRNPISTGWSEIDRVTQGGTGRGELSVVVAPSGCHAKGTKILMYDGTLKNVEDIIIGDEIMGPDSLSRIVLKLHRGKEKMYEIKPVKGDSFVVNAGHILSLRNCNTHEVINLTVEEYIKKSNNFKNTHKLYRSEAIEFSNKSKLDIEPYHLGILLGDGSFGKGGIAFCTADATLEKEINLLGENFGLNVRKYPKKNNKATNYNLTFKKGFNNPLKDALRKLELNRKGSSNKFIPQEYKLSSIENRKQLLAGILDTDGYLSNGCFDYISKSKQLADDVVFIARSLGLAAYISECRKSCQNGFTGTYYRVSISGDCAGIPTKLSRKQALPRKSIKNVLNVGFEVIEKDVDDYYGFTVDKDHLYLIDDFTVVHNCGKSMFLVHLGAKALEQGKNVVYYTLELRDTVVAGRFDSCITGIPLNDLVPMKEKVLDQIKGITGKLIVKEYPTKTASVSTIKNHLEKLKRSGFMPDMILVDYADLLRASGGPRTDEKRHQLEGIYEDLRALAQIYQVSIVTASQTNRTGINAEVITMESISEAYNKCFVADFIFSVSRTMKDKENNEGRIYVAKNRNGPDGIVFPIFMDTANVKIEVMSQSHETIEQMQANSMKQQEQELKEKYRNFKNGRI